MIDFIQGIYRQKLSESLQSYCNISKRKCYYKRVFRIRALGEICIKMRNLFSRIIILLFCTISVISFVAIEPLFADEVVMAADPWCPFTCVAGSDHEGLLVDVARKVFEGAGHKFKYQTLNWARALEETRDGKFNAVLGSLKTDAPDFTFPNLSVANQASCFYVKKESSWTYKDVSSLESVFLGAVLDYTYGDPVDAYIARVAKNNKRLDLVSGVDATKKLFLKLLDGRNDVVIEEKSVVEYVMSNTADLKNAQVKAVGCLKESPLFVAFSPKNPNSKKYAKLFDQEFKKIKSSPQWAEILKKYSLK